MTNYLKAMPIKPLIILPDPLLRLVSKPVERVDDGLRRFATDMLTAVAVNRNLSAGLIISWEDVEIIEVRIA